MALASFWRRRHRHREGGSTHGSAGNIPELGKKGSGSASGGGSQFFPRRPSLPGALDKYGQFALSQEKLATLCEMSGLSGSEVTERFQEFAVLADGKPSRGLNAKQFHSMYKRSFPNAINPARLAASVFRLCDANRDGVVDFDEFLTSVCVPPSRIPTASKFRTLFRVLDTEGVGHLTPGSLAMAMRDVYDVVGMLDAGDPHRDAIELYNKIDHGTDCRVYEKEFSLSLLADPRWVSLFEGCNFCVPSSYTSYLGPSSFYGLPTGHTPEEEIVCVRSSLRTAAGPRQTASASGHHSAPASALNSDSEDGGGSDGMVKGKKESRKPPPPPPPAKR